MGTILYVFEVGPSKELKEDPYGFQRGEFKGPLYV